MERRWAGFMLPPVILWMAAGSLLADEDFDSTSRLLEHVQVTAKRRETTNFEVSAAVMASSPHHARHTSPLR